MSAVDAITKPWTSTATAYQAALGVHQPWIAEISPYQHGRLSTRGRAVYEQKRGQAWQASADCKAEWRRRVVEAYHDGRFDLSGSDVTDEARSAVHQALAREEEERAAAILEQAGAKNRIGSTAELCPSDRVYCLLAGRYGTVQRTHKVSARLRFDDGREWTANVRGLQWLHHNELKAATEAGR